MRKFLPIIGALLLFSIACMEVQAQDAQVFIVRGKVTSSKDKSVIDGVSVTEIDRDDRIVKGTSTDIEGNFALKMSNPKNRISVAFIGYKSTVFSPAGKTTHNIQLDPSGKDMDEVIVVADKKNSNGMMSVSEKYRTTATASISAKEMEEMQASSIDQALQGRLPGVDITASSGDPGAAMSIRIRGTSSINGNDNPLIVVDGMPYETTVPSDFNFGTADEQGYASLLNIAPSDIKDITVLKDAAATAVWGSQAAGGVLVINTKRGSMGRPSLTYTIKGSLSKAPAPIPLLTGDQYSMLIPEMVMNRTGAPLNTQTQKEFSYDPTDPYWYRNYGNNTNWVDAITQIGNVQDHNLSMTGGGEKARYYASVGYFNSKGTTIGTGLNRISTRINLDYNVSAKLRFRTDLAYTHSVTDRNYVNGSSASADGIRNVAYNKMPNMSIYEFDEYGILTPNYFSPAGNIQGQYTGTYNPVAMALTATNQVVSERMIPHFNLQYDIIPKRLQLIGDLQFDINNNKNKMFLPQIATGRPWTETVVNRPYDGDGDFFTVLTKLSLAYTPKLPENHTVTMFASLNTADIKYVSHQAATSNTASSLLQDVSTDSRVVGTGLNISSSQTQTRTVGLLLNGMYNYKGRYIINGSIRGDGNSKFGPNSRYGLFPAISTRWRAGDEPFMHRYHKWLDDLSVRGSYGQSGNAPKYDYSFYNTYSTYNYTYLGQSAIYPASMELKNLRWETTKELNLGFNLSVLQRRVSLDLDFYRRRITDMFYNGLQISSFTGFNSVNMNVGTMDNQGWEINLNATILKKKDYTLDFNFNVAHNDNIIREISEFYPREKGNIETNGQYKSLLQENNPFGSFYGFKFKGVYKDMAATVARDESGKPITGPNGQTVYMRFNYPKVNYLFQPGDAIYEDINHDGNIDYKDVVYLGNSNPRFTGGFGPTLTFKRNLRVSAFFNYRAGMDIINGTKMSTTAMYNFNNQSTAVLRRWRKEGDVTDMPRAVWGTGYNWLGSDRYVESGSFVRLRTITVRYTVPKVTTDKLRLKSLSAYVTAENLYTFSTYTGQDPEVSLRGSDPFRVAIDYSMTPPPLILTLGISATF
jgi:TonB-linked SusC/RagA family outer membrane protein